jgi:hypothetical protein
MFSCILPHVRKENNVKTTDEPTFKPVLPLDEIKSLLELIRKKYAGYSTHKREGSVDADDLTPRTSTTQHEVPA